MDKKRTITYNVYGGQINTANDKSTIHATQNNGVTLSELDNIINGITENLSPLKKEDVDAIEDVINMIKEEFAKPEPKVNRLRNYLNLIAPMFTIANGIPDLSEHLHRLIDYINMFIH